MTIPVEVHTNTTSALKKELEQKFAVGYEFDAIDALRDCAINYGEKYNCPMTIGKSKKKKKAAVNSHDM
jgi:hypothetical protein